MDPFTREGLPAMRFRRRAILSLFLLTACFVLSGSSYALTDQSNGACESAEDCFRAAVSQGAPTNAGQARVDRAQAVQRTIEKLKTVQEKHAGSIWARRAGLLMGL